MDKLLEKNKAEAEARMWPLGKPEGYSEPPLWQDICQGFVYDVVRPYSVTRLIEELERLGSEDDEESTAYATQQAREAAAPWDEACQEHGWRECEEFIDVLDSPGDHTKLLVRLMNLIAEQTNSEELAHPDDIRFYWMRRIPAWEGDQVKTDKVVLPWFAMIDAAAGRRAGEDEATKLLTELEVEYDLGWVTEDFSKAAPRLRDTDAWVKPEEAGATELTNLDPANFATMGELIAMCSAALTAWVKSEWLEPQGFLNFRDTEWSELTDWKELADQEGIDDVDLPETLQWFTVSEFAARHLKELGEVVVDEGTGVWGRGECGQSMAFDGCIQNIMFRLGHLKKVPPLGALNPDHRSLPTIRVSLGGGQFPFSIGGYLEDRELEMRILNPVYREAGWAVCWGPATDTPETGPVRTFSLGLASGK